MIRMAKHKLLFDLFDRAVKDTCPEIDRLWAAILGYEFDPRKAGEAMERFKVLCKAEGICPVCAEQIENCTCEKESRK